MKTVSIKCAKCGKEWTVNYKTAKKLIACPHCHKQYCLDPSSLRKLKYSRYLMMLLMALLFAWGIEEFTNNNNVILIAGILVFAFVLYRYIDEMCRAVAFTIFKFNYMELDEYAKIRKPVIGEKKK